MTTAATRLDTSRASLTLYCAASVAAVGCWGGWLAWDTRYDRVSGSLEETGPYEAWQVLGCVLTLSAVLILAQVLRADPLISSVAVVGSFTLAITVGWAVTSDDGLFLVGAFLVGLAASCGAFVVSLVVGLATRGRRGLTTARYLM